MYFEVKNATATGEPLPNCGCPLQSCRKISET